MTNLTPGELAVLKAIDDSEYGDVINDAVWTFTIQDNIKGIAVSSIPGICSSLTKKGFIFSDMGGNDDEATIGMTDEGARAYIAFVGEENVTQFIPEHLKPVK